MFRQCFYLALLSATAAIAFADDLLLDVTYQSQIPTGPVTGAANMSAGSDAKGNLYVLVNGLTNICKPVGQGPCVLQPASYLVKMNPQAGTILFQETLPFLSAAMAVDPAGDIYLADGNVVEKLGTDGTTILNKKTIGGQSLSITAMTLDATGRLYLTGAVNAGDLPATSGAFQQSVPDGSGNGFVVRLNASGDVDYATYLRDNIQNPYGLAVDASGSAFVMWTTQSSAFPTTPGAPFSSGLSYIARLAADGSGLIYSTFAGPGEGWLMAADSTGHAVVALATAYGSGLTVTRFNPQGTAVVFSRTLPGYTPGGLGVDASGNTYSFESLLPASANFPAKNSLFPCGTQQGLTVFDPNGAILQSTYLQGPGNPQGLFVLPDSTVDLFGGSLGLAHLAQNSSAKTVQLGCIGNAASYDNGISPGELVSLFGKGLGPDTGAVPQVQLATGFPTEVANVEVTFNGVRAALLYVQDSQINAIVPWSLQAGQSASVCVVYNGAETNCLRVDAGAADPGVFMVDPYHAAALNQDGTLNSASNPATIGSEVAIFATGLGTFNPLPSDGAIVGLPLPVDLLPASMSTVTLGPYVPVTVKYAGPAPGEVAGVSQINFIVDANAGGPYATYLFVGAAWNQAQSNPFYIWVAQ